MEMETSPLSSPVEIHVEERRQAEGISVIRQKNEEVQSSEEVRANAVRLNSVVQTNVDVHMTNKDESEEAHDYTPKIRSPELLRPVDSAYFTAKMKRENSCCPKELSMDTESMKEKMKERRTLVLATSEDSDEDEEVSSTLWRRTRMKVKKQMSLPVSTPLPTSSCKPLLVRIFLKVAVYKCRDL